MRKQRVQGEWQLIPTLLLGLLVLVIAAIAGLWWWAGTEHSLQWAWKQVTQSQPLSAEGMSGTLRSGLNVRHLTWERDGLKIEADDVEIAWRPLFLLGGTVKLDRAHAAALRITDHRPPSKEPWKLPDSLAIRPDVELDDLRIGSLEWTTQNTVRAEDLAGRYWYDSDAHEVRLESLRWAGGSYRASARLGASTPMPLDATITGTAQAPVPGGAQTLPVEFTATLRGPLDNLQATGQVRSTAAGTEATHATATARVTLWAQQPVPEAQAQLSALDLASLWPQAPHTALAGRIEVAPAGTDTWQVSAELRNATPGPWDELRLPIAQLEARGQWRKGMALVQSLDARLGGGRMKATGQWRPGDAGWTLRGDLTGVDPAALHTRLAAAPLGGRVDLRQDKGAIVFDLTLKGSGGRGANKANARGARAKKPASRLEIRQIKANGRWADGHLSVPIFALVASDATLHGTIDAEIASRSGTGRLSLQAPGLRATANGELSETAGRGNAQIDSSDLALAQRWLQRLPGLKAARNAPPVAGRAAVTLAWQGGWSDPTVQARLTSPSLEVGAPREPGAPSWVATDVVASLNGRLSDAMLSAKAHARQGQRQVGLQLAGRGGRAPLRRGAQAQWRGNIASLDISVLDPAVSRGAWQLALQRPVDVRWTPSSSALEVTAGQATLSAPTMPGAAPPAQAVLAWEPVRWRQGELRTAGRLTGLPLGWIELIGGSQLAGVALSGDMVFDAQWDATLGRELRLNASLARSRGDVTVLAETAPGVSSRVAAGVREARLTLSSQGEQATLTLRWDSERAGVADGRLTTRLARGGSAGWQWPAEAPISGTLSAQLPRIGVWSLLAPPGWRLRGSLAADIKAAGTRADPRLSGTVSADDLALRSVVDGVELRDGRLRARLDGSRLMLTEFTLRGAGEQSGGTLSATGEATWAGGGPRLQARAQITRLRASIRSDRQLTVSGRLEASVDPTATRVRGNLKVDQARITLPDETEPRLGDDVIVRNAPALGTTARERKMETLQTAGATPAREKRPLDIAVNIDLGDDFQVQGRGLRTRLRGTLALSGQSLAAPQLVGTITTVRGEYRAYNQRLDVERGVLRFTGPVDNPSLDILAVRPNITQRVGVLITGTAQAPFVRLYSEPEMPDAEKLAWLVTGRPVPSTGAEAALVQQAALALLSSRRPGATSFASRLGLDELSVRRSESAGAVVSLGKRFADNFYASYERSLSGALGTLYIFYDVSRRLTIRAEAGEQTGVDLIFTFAFD